MAGPFPFKVETTDKQISDLKDRLMRVIWPTNIEDPKWEYGTELSYMRNLCDYWITKFNWRHWEARLNSYPNYLVEIDGIKIHFLHIKSKKSKSIPLILTHGWPSSVLEYFKMIPLLEGETNRGFDLIIPSLPGYGFSSAPQKSGFSIFKTAELWHTLMTKVLGYSRYAAHGGDWGAYLASRLAYLHPSSLYGIHLSYVVGGIVPRLEPNASPLSTRELEALEKRKQWNLLEGGYEHLQSTKPQTIAYALSDSPIGLAAWIIEKWRSWTDCGGDLDSKFTKDELLANISWYWFTNTAATSMRLYYETRVDPWDLKKNDKIGPAVAIASFPKELVVSPKEWAERIYKICQWTEMPRGGHFAAAEEPELLAADIRKFFFETLAL